MGNNGKKGPGPKRIAALGINLILLFVTTGLLFLLGELALRAQVYFESRKSFEKLMRNLPQPANGIAQHLGQIIQPSRYPGIIYELRPDMTVHYMNALIKTNSQGFRSDALDLKKGRNTVRIVGLGDSHMFGWGVPQEKTYMVALGERLNGRFPQKKWEIINAGVPGYNTYMEIETLSKKALAYDPDIVIMEYIGNDLALPNFLMESPDCFSLKRSFLLDFLRSKFKLIKINVNLVVAPDRVTGDGPEDDLDRMPERYRYMCGFQAFEKSMIRLKRMQETEGFEVVICFSQQGLIETEMFERMQELCERLKFHVLIDLQQIEPSLILSKEDTHPNELAHRLKADILTDFMIREKIVEKYSRS